MPHSRAMKRLEADQAGLDERMSGLQSTANECEKGMKELKVVLYAKFGSSINLDEVSPSYPQKLNAGSGLHCSVKQMIWMGVRVSLCGKICMLYSERMHAKQLLNPPIIDA
jgi:hypothetical protein